MGVYLGHCLTFIQVILLVFFYMKQSDTPARNFRWKSNQHLLQAVVLTILSFLEIQIQYFDVDIKSPFTMIISTFKGISFFGVLNWVTVHSQIAKCVRVISTPHDGKVKHARVFQIGLKKYGKISPPRLGMRNFGGDFFIGRWEPVEEWFWVFKPFSNLKAKLYEYWTLIKIKISLTYLCR